MAISQELPNAFSEQPAKQAAQFESARSAVLAAVGWCVLAELSGIPVGFVMAMIQAHSVSNVSLSSPIVLTVMIFLTSSILLLGVRKQSGIVGHGDHHAGVDDGPITRWWFLTTLLVLSATWAFFASAAWYELVPQWPAIWHGAGAWTIASFALAAAVLAPLAEELFFRGWLWTALRRHWSALPTGVLTSGFWLALHLDRGLLLSLVLLPIAILLGCARHFCGIRAAVILHAVYNFIGSVVFLLFPALIISFTSVLPPQLIEPADVMLDHGPKRVACDFKWSTRQNHDLGSYREFLQNCMMAR